MLHVIGLAHRAQSRTPGNVETEAQQTFRRCLDQTIRDVHPAFIAEEDSEEAFAERHETSIGREISQAKGLEH